MYALCFENTVPLPFLGKQVDLGSFPPPSPPYYHLLTPLIVLVQLFEYLLFRFHYWNSMGLEDRLIFLPWIVSLIQFIVWPYERLYYPGWWAAEEECKRNSRDECLGKWPVKLTLLPKKMHMNLISLAVFVLVCQHNSCFCSWAFVVLVLRNTDLPICWRENCNPGWISQ